MRFLTIKCCQRQECCNFFIWYDRNYGLSMQESGYPNHTYQVVYHEKIDESITEADVLSMGIKTTRDLEKKIYMEINITELAFL